MDNHKIFKNSKKIQFIKFEKFLILSQNYLEVIDNLQY